MRAATVVQQFCKSCGTCFMFYCMFYFTCDRSLRWTPCGHVPTLVHSRQRHWEKAKSGSTTSASQTFNETDCYYIRHCITVLQVLIRVYQTHALEGKQQICLDLRSIFAVTATSVTASLRTNVIRRLSYTMSEKTSLQYSRHDFIKNCPMFGSC